METVTRTEMEVRMALSSDFETIQELYSDYTGEHMDIAVYDKPTVDESIRRMIKDGALILAVMEEKVIGFAAGYFQKCHFSKDVMFSLMYLYVKKSERQYSGHFLAVLKELLKKTDATKFVVSRPAFSGNEKLDRFYQIHGFKPLETHFYLEIQK